MNKKLISLAVAAAMVAPAAALADATIYGKVHVSIDYVDLDDFVTYPGVLPGHPSHSGSGGDPVAAAGSLSSDDSPLGAGYLGALQNGTADDAGTMVTMPVPEFQTTYDTVLAEKMDAGWSADAAMYAAIKEAGIAGRTAATSEQLRAAVLQGLDAGRGHGYSGWDVTSVPGASRFGLKGSEDLGGGLKAIYQIEIGIDPAEGTLGTRLRNTFVGLAGGWGTALVGRHDTPLKISTGKLDMFADTMADYNFTVGFEDNRASNAIAYISPSFSGFQLAGAIVAPGLENEYTDAFTGVTKTSDDGSLAEAYSVAGIYKNGPFYGSIAYESFSDSFYKDDDEFYKAVTGKGADDHSFWRAGLGVLDWNGFTLSGVYESHSNYRGAPRRADGQLWQIQAAYKFGSNRVKGMYGQADLEKCADPYGRGFRYTCDIGGLDLIDNKDKSVWAIGFDHNFSKRTTAYALYTALDDDIDNSDWSGFSLGLIHKF